jgi:hypothetical protein
MVMKGALSHEESKERSMKIPVPVVLAIAALSIAALSCGTFEALGTSTGSTLSISASPSTFKSVGEIITFTYTVDAIDYITRSKSQGVTDNAADTTPSCSVSNDGKQLICKATHIITAEDVALGYVTSSAKFKGYISPIMGGWIPIPGDTESEYHEDDATTVVYIENFAPSPTPTITPLSSPTPTATPDPSANAEVIFEKGNTTDLVDCSGTEFAFTVKDPQGVKQVFIEFAVAGFDTDFSKIATTLDLTNSGGDTWSGIFNDTVSTQGQVTYWRVVVVDNNGIQTVYHEDGKFSFYAGNKSCK